MIPRVPAFRSAKAVVAESGWVDMGDWEITSEPLIDPDAPPGIRYARMGGKAAAAALKEYGAELPSVNDMRALEKVAAHIEPVVLPTGDMCLAADVHPNNTAMVQRFREANMMGAEWCAIHDLEVARLIRLAGAAGPVDNIGKHLVSGANTPGRTRIFGWPTPHAQRYGAKPGADRIQGPSDFHDEFYADYATLFHGRRKKKP